MIWGFLDMSMMAKTNIFHLYRHPNTSNHLRRKRHHFPQYCLGNLNLLEIEHFETIGEMRADNPDYPCDKFLKTCIWDQYVPENIKNLILLTRVQSLTKTKQNSEF